MHTRRYFRPCAGATKSSLTTSQALVGQAIALCGLSFLILVHLRSFVAHYVFFSTTNSDCPNGGSTHPSTPSNTGTTYLSNTRI